MTEQTISLNYSDKDVSDRLNRLLAQVGDLTPAMEDIGEFEVLQHDLRHDREVDFRGNPLIPNAQRTIEYKKANGLINKFLQATGTMRSRTAYLATSDSVTITNNDSKARRHQFGIGVPKREIFGINQSEDVPEIIAILDEHLMS